MYSDALTSLIRPMELTRRIVWIALNAAILLYVFVGCILFGVPSTLAGAFSHAIALPLAAAAVASAIAAQAVPARLLSPQRLDELLRTDPDLQALARNPQTGQPDDERRRAIEALPLEERRLLAVAGASFTPFIVQLALQDAVAVFGLVLAILSKSAAPAIPFAAAALLLNLRVSPKLDVEAVVRRAAVHPNP